ncbi:hypothetical protein SynROS8604_01454 [Synechococcus sp. ROS8604]|nr:hypothetical protein SynROS8604_01454 [Synechococcus sp. ROS8604]
MSIYACAPIKSLNYTARNSGELIKCEFGIFHWFISMMEVLNPKEQSISRMKG